MSVHQPVDIGSDFLGYRIEELIGRGGMGVVYRAYDLRLKRTVALKLVAPSLARDGRFRERFARESELVMSLEHPNVVPIYDAGDFDGRVYLAMRLVAGTDLGSLLRTAGGLEPARAIAICSQIATALDAAHAHGLVHRDVKPSNVLLDKSEHVYLADFGLTRRLDDDGVEAGSDSSVGTPAYLAPEQLEGRPVDGRADIYSLGCVLYECLTGEPVFPRTSRLAVAWAHLEEEPPRPTRVRTELPQAIDAVLARALAKAPEERYPTCTTLVAAAGNALGLGTTDASRRRRNLALAIALIVAVAAVGIVVGTKLTHGARKVAAAAHLFARPNTLARIDPATGKVSNVFPVGSDPVVAAASDYTTWVYNRGSESISQIDGFTNRRVGATHVSLPTECCSLFTGPVLAADPSGAWFVEGGFAGRQALLVHVPVGQREKREYQLPLTPTGVAVGDNSVWIVGHDGEDEELLRVDPSNGRVIARTQLPASAQRDSIAFGFGRVWVVSSTTATLYRIDPLSRRITKKKLAVGRSRATRPEILFRGHDLFVRVAGDGGLTYWIDPSLRITNTELDGPPGHQENVGQLGSLWWYDWTTGIVYQQEQAGGPTRDIRVARPVPGNGGPCLTSMAVGSGSLWLTVAPSTGSTCSR